MLSSENSAFNTTQSADTDMLRTATATKPLAVTFHSPAAIRCQKLRYEHVFTESLTYAVNSFSCCQRIYLCLWKEQQTCE